MTVVKITTFSDALLYALQQRMQEGYEPRLTFRQIWSVCFASALGLHGLHSTFDRSEIIRLMFVAVDKLHEREFVCKLKNGGRLHAIELTPEGIASLKAITFGGQEKLNKMAWEGI